MVIPKLALRNLLGAGLRTWLNVLVLSFSYVAIIWMQGIYKGMNDQVEQATIGAQYGGGQYWHKAYDPYDPLSLDKAHGTIPDALQERIVNKEATPILIRQGTIYPEGRFRTVLLKGIDPSQSTLIIPSSLLSNEQEAIPALIGTRMAQNTGLKKDDYLTVQWRDVNGLMTLGQQQWPWAENRITAGVVLDLRKEARVGKYLMFFHGGGPGKNRTQDNVDANCSLGIAWSDDLEDWNWPGKVLQKSTAAEPKNIIVNSVGMRLKYIKPGEFLMGSSGNEKGQEDDELPQHPVKLTRGFYMGVTEVTQAQWVKVMESSPWLRVNKEYVRTGDDYPAVNINWNDAVEFCKKLSQKEGRKYRLPTEAEWEYACRAGTKTAYSFGDDDSKLGDYGWFRGNAYDAGEKYAHIAGQKKPNPWGLYDMHGNVWEWCSDWSGDYAAAAVTDPTGPSSGTNRVLRSGSGGYIAGDSRSAERGGSTPDSRTPSIGFRVVVPDFQK